MRNVLTFSDVCMSLCVIHTRVNGGETVNSSQRETMSTLDVKITSH